MSDFREEVREGLRDQIGKVEEIQRQISKAKMDLQGLSNQLTMAIGARTFAAGLLFGEDADLQEAWDEDRDGIRTGESKP